MRSLYSYLQTYGYTGVNPAHGDFVTAPAVPRDGKTVALSPEDCRRFLDAPADDTPAGVRDRALLAVLAYTGCRVGELSRLAVGSYKASGGHKVLGTAADRLLERRRHDRVLEVYGKGGKERRVPLHPEAFERPDVCTRPPGVSRGRRFRPTRETATRSRLRPSSQ